MRRSALPLFVPLVVALISAAFTLFLYPFVHFARPNSLWWLIALVGLAAIWAWKAQRRRTNAARFLHANALERLTASWSPRRATVRFGLVALASYALIIASAQPQWGEQTRRIQREGIDIVVVLDASRSMLAEDAAPDRLRAATEELDRLLTTLDGDRVGLVVFAGLAFTQSPLTTDYGAIRLYLSRVNPDAIPSQGTALGRAINEAHHLLIGGDNEDFRRAPNQLIIVVSDGEDHETNPVQAARAAYEDGIRVFTVGVGTSAGGRIPLRDPRGNFAGYLTDRNGQVVNTHLEDQQLQEIAEAGGGAYQRYSGSGSSASFLAAEVDKFDQAALSSILRAHYVDRGHFFLWPAFLLMFLALMIDERPRNARRGRWFNILLVLLLVAPLSGCLDFKQRDPHVRRAVEYAERDQLTDALEALDRANQDAKSQHAFRFNRARMSEAVEAFEQAQEDYLFALGAPAEGLRNAALIGLGNALFHQGDYPAAHERYRRALTVDPQNPAARRNLEIAHRRLFPACTELEDALEPNNTPDEAKPLPAKSYRGEWAELYAQHAPPAVEEDSTDGKETLTLCGGNQDWFLIPVEGGELLELTVQLQRLRDDDGGPPLPNQVRPTAIRISLLDQHGEVRAVDQGLSDDPDAPHLVSATKLTRRIRDIRVEPGAAPYFLKISADPNLEYSYDIQAKITPPCSALEDHFEPNDTFSNASALESGEHRAHICADNEDWFEFPLKSNEQLFVDVQATPSKEQPEPHLRTAFPRHADDSSRPSFRNQTHPGRVTWASGSTSQAQQLRWGIASQADHEGPYQMDVFHFEDCPTGNDRFEPNDRPSRATPLTAEQNELRHLRLCPQDEDWFVMELPEPEDPNANEPRAFSAVAEFNEAGRQVRIELWDPRTGERVAVSQPADPVDGGPENVQHAVIAAIELPQGAEAVVIRVIGEAGFYHLRFPDTEAPQSDDSESDQSDESEEDSDQSDDEDASDSDESDDGDEDQDDADDADAEDADAEDGEPDDDPVPPAQQPPPEEDDEEAQRRALMQLLESLEDDSFNLQLMQALEREPPSRMQNEW